MADYWEKCGTSKDEQSYTVKGVRCQNSCEMKRKTLTEDYWWCNDDDQDPSSWDYCSPPGQVLEKINKFKSKKETTRCGLCNTQGMATLVWGCALSRGRTTGGAQSPAGRLRKIHLSLSRWAGTDNQEEDDWWEYCSPSKHRTRLNIGAAP